MRTLATAFTLVLIINLIAGAGFVGWLAMSGRLDKQRVQQTVDMYRVTVDQQAADEARLQEEAEEQAALEQEAIRMEQVAGGPLTPEQVLNSLHDVDAYYDQLIKRRDAEVTAIQRQIDSTRAMVEAQYAQLEAERAEFQALQERWLEASQEEDFKQAVAMLEGIPARQAKQVLQDMLGRGEEQQVVSYLAAMDERKANGVLKEFKTPEEVAQAAQLIEQVRLRSGLALQEAGL